MSNRPDVVLRSGELTLTFFWQGDRYQHRVTDGVHGCESVESESIESPVYTDLHRQGDLLFLSGNAGIGHWSASVVSTDGGFLFEIAVRLKEAPGTLGSTYKTAEKLKLTAVSGCQLTPGDPASLNWTIAAGAKVDTVPATCQYAYRLAGGE